MEIPCTLKFEGASKITAKAKELIEFALDKGESIDECPPSKKQKEEEAPTQPTGSLEPSTWKWRFGVILTDMDKKIICKRKELNNQIMHRR